jgi:hypothetical protein
MKSRPSRLLLVVPIAALLAFAGAVGVGLTPKGQITARGVTYRDFNPIQDRLLDGPADLELNPTSQAAALAKPSAYFPGRDDCSQASKGNVKVNQNCQNVTDANLQGRAQAQNETSIAYNPSDPRQLVASFNDYRRGDGNCYGAWSTDGGRSWNDSTVPMSFTRGALYGAARQYWQAGGDTSVAFDTKGNAYLSCQMFQRGAGVTPNPDLSSAFFVFRSTQNFGASWNFPGRPVAQSPDVKGTGNASFLDKQLMTVDNHPGSPFQDRVYVTWTTFAVDGTAYIYEAYSADYAEHFSAPVLVSRDSALCGNTFGVPTPHGRCNENQFSQPFTGGDGALYVIWSNYNNVVAGNDNRNQVLEARSVDGGVTFGAPVKVSDYYDLPDCPTYQGGADPGRACVPEKNNTANSIFRAANYGSGAVNPTNPHQVVVSVGSYINRHSNEANGCTPAGVAADGQNLFTGVKTAGACNNDLLVSVSNNAGASFSGAATDPRAQTSVTSAPGQATTDQWWQWLAFNPQGKLAISYYDREYGSDEATGYSDVSLSGSGDASDFGVRRVTSLSMPPPTQFGGVFFGDYTGLAAPGQALPLWMDTRNPEVFICPGTATPGNPPQLCNATTTSGVVANDQDIFTDSVGIPANHSDN